MKKQILSLLSILLIGFSIGLAQTPTETPKIINGGVINGKAKSLPIPAYPAAAMAVRASGAVNVQVTIDEEGNVISASAVSGHPLLRQASEQAARMAKFSPTKLSGQPVKVTGVIVYNFAPTQTNEERVKILEIATFLFLVRGSATDIEKLNLFFETQDFIKDSINELPDFAKEIAPLASLKTLPIEKRFKTIDGVSSSIRNKLSANEAWQFDLGKNFGEFFAQLILASNEGEFDITKLNESNLQLNLIKINELTYSAPSDFPTDVLEKFKEFSKINEKEYLVTLENLQALLIKAVAIVETIFPETTK